MIFSVLPLHCKCRWKPYRKQCSIWAFSSSALGLWNDLPQSLREPVFLSLSQTTWHLSKLIFESVIVTSSTVSVCLALTLSISLSLCLWLSLSVSLTFSLPPPLPPLIISQHRDCQCAPSSRFTFWALWLLTQYGHSVLADTCVYLTGIPPSTYKTSPHHVPSRRYWRDDTPLPMVFSSLSVVTISVTTPDLVPCLQPSPVTFAWPYNHSSRKSDFGKYHKRSSRHSCLENTKDTVPDSPVWKLAHTVPDSHVWKIPQTQFLTVMVGKYCYHSQVWKILQTPSCWQSGLENIEDSSCRWHLESNANSYGLPRYIKYSKHGSWQSGLKSATNHPDNEASMMFLHN